MNPRHALSLFPPIIALSLLGAGCSSPKPETMARPDYGRPLAPGQSALRLIPDPGRYPDLRAAWQERGDHLMAALDESAIWFAAPSSRRTFPFEGITHRRAAASVRAMRELLETTADADAFYDEFTRLFQVYESVGYDGSGVVLFTGYFSPVFSASLDRTDRFRYPLYNRPADLLTDELTGAPLGRRRPDGGREPYATRGEIERSGMLAGTEIAWLENPLDAYIVHVNGSAKLRLRNGRTMYIGYAGKTDRPYASLGQAIVEDGLLDADEVTLPSIRRVGRTHPERVQKLMERNENYVFFTEYPDGSWPAGSLGVRVTRETSLATDKDVYPRGGLVLVDTDAVSLTEGTRAFRRFMVDQDTGGAIKAPGRADIFMGIGASAEIVAGGQYAEGRLYYFFLKTEHVAPFTGRDPGRVARSR